MSDNGQYPVCTECIRVGRTPRGVLLPLSDFGRDNSSMTYRSHVCSNKECGFVVDSKRGQARYIKVGEEPTP